MFTLTSPAMTPEIRSGHRRGGDQVSDLTSKSQRLFNMGFCPIVAQTHGQKKKTAAEP